MRLLQIIHGEEAGGIRTLADSIGAALAAEGVHVDRACLFPPRPAGRLAKLAGMLRAAGLIIVGRYDALVAYQSSAAILVGVVGWLARCPRRIVHQTALPGEVKAPLRWLDRLVGASGLYTANVLNSRATWTAFARYPARYRRDMVLIEHGVAAPVATRSRRETLGRFALPDDGSILLNVGRLAAQKNQDVLIAALAQLPTTRLVICGAGPLQARYEALATTSGVGDRLHLLGDVGGQDVSDLLAAADAFVFPSVWESFGLAAVEAALAGLPIVAADLPVLREVLSGHDAVSFVAPHDTAAWIRAIDACIEAGRTTASWGAESSVAARYSVQRMMAAYAKLLCLDAPVERGVRRTSVEATL